MKTGLQVYFGSKEGMNEEVTYVLRTLVAMYSFMYVHDVQRNWKIPPGLDFM